MSYELEYKDAALRLLEGEQFGDVLDCIFNSLEILAADPVQLSRPSQSPIVPRGQQYEFGCESQEASYRFTVHFCYAQDEKSLVVVDIVPRRIR